MYKKTKVILPRKFWDSSKSKKELKEKIASYMSKNYPNYRVVEVHKYYAVCENLE